MSRPTTINLRGLDGRGELCLGDISCLGDFFRHSGYLCSGYFHRLLPSRLVRVQCQSNFHHALQRSYHHLQCCYQSHQHCCRLGRPNCQLQLECGCSIGSTTGESSRCKLFRQLFWRMGQYWLQAWRRLAKWQLG